MKITNLTTVLKLLLLSAAVLITCVVVKISFIVTDEAREISASAIDQMSEMNHDLSDSGIMMYDDNEVYGSDVLNFIKKTLGDYSSTEIAPIYVSVKTSVSDNTYKNNVYIPDIKNFTNTHYIKPTAIFVGDVIKNTNDVTLGIRFTVK